MPTMRNRYYGGGGGRTISFGLPPFTRAIKWLVLINAAIFLLMLILRGVAPSLFVIIFQFGELLPAAVVHGIMLNPLTSVPQGLWQIVTYSFIHADFWHIVINMLMLWMWGATLEVDWGFRRFLDFFFFCVVGAALTTIGVSYLGTLGPLQFLGITPLTATV